MADNSRQLILWIAAFAGGILIYAAYKNKSPLSLAEDFIGMGTPGKTTDNSQNHSTPQPRNESKAHVDAHGHVNVGYMPVARGLTG